MRRKVSLIIRFALDRKEIAEGMSAYNFCRINIRISIPIKDAQNLLKHIQIRKSYKYLKSKLSLEAISEIESNIYNEIIYQYALDIIKVYGIDAIKKQARNSEMFDNMTMEDIATMCQLYPEDFGLEALNTLRNLPILAIDII